jgi:hypothetical protein
MAGETIYFNLTPDSVNYLTFPYQSTNSYSYPTSVAPLVNSLDPDAAGQIWYTFGTNNDNMQIYCVVGVSLTQYCLLPQGTTAGSQLTINTQTVGSQSWTFTKEGYLAFNNTENPVTPDNPQLYAVISDSQAMLSTTPQVWIFAPLQVLSLNAPFMFNPGDDTPLILTASTTENAAADLEKAVDVKLQSWMISQAQPPVNGVISQAQLVTSDSKYWLVGASLDESATCENACPGETWTITDNGDGTATFQSYQNDGVTLIGSLTNDGKVPTIKKQTSGNSQKWKFTTVKGKGHNR